MLSPHEANTTTGDVMFLRSIFGPLGSVIPRASRLLANRLSTISRYSCLVIK